jgi:hypothetical protein
MRFSSTAMQYRLGWASDSVTLWLDCDCGQKREAERGRGDAVQDSVCVLVGSAARVLDRAVWLGIFERRNALHVGACAGRCVCGLGSDAGLHGDGAMKNIRQIMDEQRERRRRIMGDFDAALFDLADEDVIRMANEADRQYRQVVYVKPERKR